MIRRRPWKAFSGVLDDPPLPENAVRSVLRGDTAAELPRLVATARTLLDNLERMSADFEFTRARAEIAKTGRADLLLARAELIRCAAQVASLAFDDCPGYQVHAVDAAAPERAYADYLAGRWAGLNAELLPAHHRAVLAAANSDNANNADDVLARIDAPFARLVAAGALLRGGRITPAGLALASRTASANGWPRPLLAWLGVTLRRATAANDREAAARLRRRIELLPGGAEKRP